ncbi:MAG: tRNA preQ1(34) S-adenosylmethionine ribosyltransferase-isomerase QueA [Legionellaceae bacterium]|nr:tRNA preQ1(34) S-adenosylmethionine ribosyltransferase-isomerase QueA [Legionellaceae bacterium]
MNTKDFDFELPPELIAQYPLANRRDSRLLRYTRATQTIEHTSFSSLADALNSGDLLVMNNSRVIPARLYGQKITGGHVELLIERILSDVTFLTHIKASKSPKPGTEIQFDGGWRIEVVEKQDDVYLCRMLDDGVIDTMLHEIGHIPLPPYITRDDDKPDVERYQTVYAKHKGSVAAPTAGLHFDDAMIEQLQAKGINIAYVTLHVGAGTFQPVRADTITDHKMHSERFHVDEALCDAVSQAKAAGKRVIAVGTTAMRSLESAARDGELKPQKSDTDIFIYPGYEFKICDGLITNFHLPQSTLLMLVSALIGHKQAMALYQEAIAEKYRFFSYGDVTLLL